MFLSTLNILPSRDALATIPEGKTLINTLNAHSFNTAQNDPLFAEALRKGDYLLPDGGSIVMACRWLKAQSQPKERVAGWDLFVYEMQRVNNAFAQRQQQGVCLFLGSSEHVLSLIQQRAAHDYPHLRIVTYSPPYKPEFSDEDSQAMVSFINTTNPDLLWIGMTAPKQEKWTYQNWNQLNIHCHVGTIGAVFDFYAGTVKRAPLFFQRHSLEWLHRLLSNPRRMWRRYILGNPLFIWNILKEKFHPSPNS